MTTQLTKTAAAITWSKELLESSEETDRDNARIQVISRLNDACRTGDTDDLELVLSDKAFSACAKDVKVAILNGGKIGGGNYPFSIDGECLGTPACTAAEFGNVKALEVLLNYGAAPDHKDRFGSTPLHMAARYGNVACLESLVDNLATVKNLHEIVDNDGNSCLHVAAQESNMAVLTYLLNYEEGVLCFSGRSDLKENLLNHANKKGDTVFHVAARWDRTKDSKVLKALVEVFGTVERVEDKGGKALDKGKKALSKRNLEGDTSAHVAARHNNVIALKWMINEISVSWKTGLLNKPELASAFVIYVVLAILFIGTIIPLLIKENNGNAANRRDTEIWCGSSEDHSFLNQDYWSCRCLPFQYYGGYVLPPNIVLICGIFLFNMLQYSIESFLIPYLYFCSFIGYKVLCTRIISADGNTSSANKFDRWYKFYCGSCDPKGQALHLYRENNYKSILHSSPDYHGTPFGYQEKYLFLYFQVAFSLYSVASVVRDLSRSSKVWEREKTRSTIPDAFLQYSNFYGIILNSSCTNTVFSVVEMVLFEGRSSQLWNGYKNLPRPYRYFFLLIYFPLILIIPPIFTHIIPGFFEFFWLFLPALAVYYIMLRVGQLMREEILVDDSWLLDKVYLMKAPERKLWCLDRVFVASLYLMGCGIESAMRALNLQWNMALKKYFYDFFFFTFARFMFIIIFQLTFDYASVSYLGHNGPEFSALYIRSGGKEGGGEDELKYGRYFNSVARVYKWRSQTYCFMQEARTEMRVLLWWL